MESGTKELATREKGDQLSSQYPLNHNDGSSVSKTRGYGEARAVPCHEDDGILIGLELGLCSLIGLTNIR